VRDLKAEHKVQHLIEIASDSNVTGTLRLFEASLTDSAPFDKAIGM